MWETIRCVLQEVKFTLEPGAVFNRRELQTASTGIGDNSQAHCFQGSLGSWDLHRKPGENLTLVRRSYVAHPLLFLTGPGPFLRYFSLPLGFCQQRGWATFLFPLKLHLFVGAWGSIWKWPQHIGRAFSAIKSYRNLKLRKIYEEGIVTIQGHSKPQPWPWSYIPHPSNKADSWAIG